MADNTRLADKLKNAFSIELLTLAQGDLENRNALPLVPITVQDQADTATYQQKRDDTGAIPWVLALVALALLFLFVRR